MILNESNATPFDLRFRLFGTYARVHPLFWVIAVVFGWARATAPNRSIKLSDSGMAELAVFVGCFFFSILLHEFGHIWMGRIFGTDGHIVLQGFGGLAVGANALYHRGKRILVSAAGPAIQLVLFGILLLGLTLRLAIEIPDGVRLGINYLLFMNLIWPLFNLLPIYPLDGGQITREVCCQLSPNRGLLASLWISLVVAGTLALNALAGEYKRPFLPAYFSIVGGLWGAIFFGLFAVGSWQAIMVQRQSRRVYEDDDALPWER